MEGNGSDPMVMSCEGFKALGSLEIPKPNRAIAATCGKGGTIMTKAGSKNRVGMPCQYLDTFTLIHIPESDRAIFTTTGENIAMTIKCH